MPGAVFVLASAGAVMVLGAWAIGSVNGLVGLDNLVQESWRHIEVELRRRHELIPDLLATVRAHVPGEQALGQVSGARSGAAAALDAGARPGDPATRSCGRGLGRKAGVGPPPVQRLAVTEGALSAALARLFAATGGHPQVHVDECFIALHRELLETQDRIAAVRRFYNANARALNAKVESFPSSLVARTFRFRRADLFEAADGDGLVSQVGLGIDPVVPLG